MRPFVFALRDEAIVCWGKAVAACLLPDKLTFGKGMNSQHRIILLAGTTRQRGKHFHP